MCSCFGVILIKNIFSIRKICLVSRNYRPHNQVIIQLRHIHSPAPIFLKWDLRFECILDEIEWRRLELLSFSDRCRKDQKDGDVYCQAMVIEYYLNLLNLSPSASDRFSHLFLSDLINYHPNLYFRSSNASNFIQL